MFLLLPELSIKFYITSHKTGGTVSVIWGELKLWKDGKFFLTKKGSIWQKIHGFICIM